MLNFRYHVVSLVAVFLALGLGILVGYGALDRPTVDFLQNRIETVEANADQQRRDNEALQSEADRLDADATSLAPFAVTDRLTDASVVFLAVRGVDEDTVTGAVDLARRAGATAPGVIWLEERWALGSDEDITALELAAGVPSGRAATVRAAALAALTARLTSADATTAAPLAPLIDAGFLAYQTVGDDPTPLAELGGAGSRLVLIVGTGDALRSRGVIVPIARTAVADGVALVVAERYTEQEDGPERASLVGVVRGDEALAARVSTVDDLDRPFGTVVTLLALADLARDAVGHFGVGDGASAPAPEWWQP